MSITSVQNNSYDLVLDMDQDIQLIMPPTPPSYSEWYGDGKFEFVKDSSTRELLINAHAAITQCESWKWFASFKEDSFMWSNSPELDRVSNVIMNTKVGQLHSGCSFGYTMRVMERIAKYGYPKFRESYLLSS